MTVHGPDDLRDARVDAAWRAASREEPPTKLDDAIRAAARREIGAGPRPAETRKNVPESLRPERWWWPLAAAATIGAIAIGLLQIGEPDHVGVPGAEKTTVSDTPAMPEQAKKQDAVAAMEADAARQAPAAKPAAPVAPPAATPPSKARDRVAPAPPPAPGALRKDIAVPFPRDESAAARGASPSSASEPRSGANAAANAATPAPPVAQPFPAETPKRESKEAAMRDAAPAAGAVAPSPAPPSDVSKAGVAEDKLATAPAEPARPAPAREAQRSAPYGEQYAQPQFSARRVQEGGDARGVISASAPKGQATAATREKIAAKLPVPDWIALIRKLRDEGRTDEAAKELAAFRSAHADHEQILPPDLRDWKPAAR